MRNSRNSSVASLLAIAALSGLQVKPGSFFGAVKEASKRQFERMMLGGDSASAGRRSFPGYGWSVAHDRRMAKKRRNQARNRRAVRR